MGFADDEVTVSKDFQKQVFKDFVKIKDFYYF